MHLLTGLTPFSYHYFQELFDRCETKRRTLFKLASETEDNDSSLGKTLRRGGLALLVVT